MTTASIPQLQAFDVDLDALCDVLDAQEPSQVRRRAGRIQPGRVISERYELREQIASGGMATIWEAVDTVLERVVAIKFLGDSYLEKVEYRARFTREAKAAAWLRTPYVAQLYDHGGHDDVPWIAMERLYGEDLHHRLLRTTRLSISFVEKIAREGGGAIKAVHDVGIIHRDLKPQNLFLAREGGEEIVKLLDFGLAKRLTDVTRTTMAGVAMGSPFYMSPEQIRGERSLDARTDLWSFAAILYRGLTGLRPFEGDPIEAMARASRGRAKPPSQTCPDLPRSLDAFFEKALAPKREDRHASITELMDCFHGAVSLDRAPSAPGVAVKDDGRDSVPTIRMDADSRPPPNPRAEPPTSPVRLGVLVKLSASGKRENHDGLRFGTPSSLPPAPRASYAPPSKIDEMELTLDPWLRPTEESQPHEEPAPAFRAPIVAQAPPDAPAAFCDPSVAIAKSAWLPRWTEQPAVWRPSPRASWSRMAVVCLLTVGVAALLGALFWLRYP